MSNIEENVVDQKSLPYKRDELIDSLRKNVVEIHFVKVNGEERKLRGTLMPNYLPKTYENEQKTERQYHRDNPDVIACWDMEKGGWRAFRIDTVVFCQTLASGY